MALNKAITNVKGVTANYHKIDKISLIKSKPKNEEDEKSHIMCVNVSSFVSEEQRRENEISEVSSRDYHIRLTLAEIEAAPSLALAYNKIKALPAFEGAEDC